MAQKTSRKTTRKKVPTTSKARSRGAKTTSAKKTAPTTKRKVAKPPRAKKATRATRPKATSKPTKKTTPRRTGSTAKTTPRRTGTTPKSATRTTKAAAAKSKQPKTRRAVNRESAKTGRAAKAVPVLTPPSDSRRRKVRRLTPLDIEEFRHILLQKRAEILGDMSTLQNEALRTNRQDASGDLSSMPIHMADLGSDNYEMEFTLGLIEGERTILKEIDEALERINNGTFGMCLATGQPIGKARLRAKPWAKYCYEYTLAQERGQTPGA